MPEVTDRYVVIGHPVAHSLSPRIHAAFARATGEAMRYAHCDVDPAAFDATVARLFSDGLSGANVTVPFKTEAAVFADVLDPRAARAGVVNTLRREPDGRVSGHNTDGTGLVRDLVEHLGMTLRDACVVVLGAGGAARGVVEPLLAAGVSRLVISNRTMSRAHELAALFAPTARAQGVELLALPTDVLPPADLLLNASAASLGGAVPSFGAAVIRTTTVAYDMMYGAAARPFIDHCLHRGAARAVDGLGMLVEQAADAFEIWRGLRPPTDAVRAMLREEP